MTRDEAVEAGRLVGALKGLAKERREFDKATDFELAFNEDLYLPRSVFLAMVEAGQAHANARLAELGVGPGEEKAS